MRLNNYTSLVQDLINRANNDTDQVSGFTMAQLENSLGGVTTWDAWRQAVRDIYGGNKADVDNLFNRFKDSNIYSENPKEVGISRL